ncbi:hypothetical protein LOTGIDRAFT_171384 [Lottia gigantea]|uniref:DNA-directed DNA polymerase n=1 Tax=Lottia gigantea TaxID=225164 RepID=V4AHD5_LOTGI|nr:hypothetical protein LOTGIDRAFT_171384 [Lottia gigantea]ESP03444.1 hypothetical protein LOTGIDRAFT_171384 [Lottia gigantea]
MVVPVLSPTPIWFPKIWSKASSVRILVYKGDRHMLLYQSKTGFREDKYGLPWNLLVVRFDKFDKKPARFRCSLVPNHVTMLVVGDSLVKDLGAHANENQLVIPVPGGKWSLVLDTALKFGKSLNCLYLIIHVGINNLNEGGNKYVHLRNLMQLFDNICQVLDEDSNFSIIFSSILLTGWADMNARVRVANRKLKEGWYYLYHYDKEMVEEECGRPFRQEENKEFVKLFNEQKFRPRTAILKVWFEYPTIMFFQTIPAKDKISFTSRIGKKETGTKIRFRNGLCYDVLTSVDIQEIVKAGGRIIKILDGIVYEENFKTPPKRDYILILRDLRNKYKREGNIIGSNCMKLLGNSLYGKSIQMDITTSRHLWSEATLKANFDSHVINYEKVNDSQYIVEINEEEKEFDCTPPKSTRLTPSHLGSFVLSHSEKIINNFIRVIDGFYKPEIYYTDTDSLYISSSNWDKLNDAGLVSENDYCKGKNDYGNGGIIFGLYLAPKVKYNIILTSDGILKEKKTFKGYSKDKISVEDYIRLANGHDVTNEFKKPWVKSFTNGVVIPKDDDKQKKVFRSYLNLVKRKAPDNEGIMYPFNNGKELNMDENYESDDYDYLTIHEENEEC